jgi:hypothetical protein
MSAYVAAALEEMVDARLAPATMLASPPKSVT